MDYLFDDNSRDDKLIEDYLFSGYKPAASKSTFGLDQQFAKPIQDEDLFGASDVQGDILPTDDALRESELDLADKTSDQQFDYSKDPFEDVRSEILCDKNTNSPGSIFEDEPPTPHLVTDGEKPEDPKSELDDIFIDDYSVSSADNIPPSTTNNENTCPEKSYSRTKPPPPPSPAQIKIQRMKQSLLEQARAMSKGPKKLGVGFEGKAEIQVSIGHDQLQSDTNSKFIFNKLFNKSKKAKDSNGSPESLKRSWEAQKDSLRKRICAQKRKIWESFQRPTDVFDDEEELIEVPQELVSERKDDVMLEDDDDHQSDQLENSDEQGDGNFEDLEREDKASSDEDEDEVKGQDDQDASSDEDEEGNMNDDDYDKLPDGDTNDPECPSIGMDSQLSVNEEIDADASPKKDEIPEETEDSDDEIDTDEDSESDSELDEVDNEFSLDLEEESNSEKIEQRKRRAIFIDDEASEDE